jgi:hypothetical protein
MGSIEKGRGTMSAIVIYESVFGNTGRIAEAVAEGLRDAGDEVALLPVADAKPDAIAGADLVVLGGPTHVHGMSSARTRQGAVEDARKHPERAEPDVTGPALRDWLAELGQVPGTASAAFDTRVDKPMFITGSAAKGIAKRLREHGFTVVGEESFLVTGTDGPLAEGELDRARAWAATLVRSEVRAGT